MAGIKFNPATGSAQTLNFAAALETSAHHLTGALRDQPRRALVAGVDPHPAQCHAEPVAQADQEVDVGDAPYPPGDGAVQPELAEIDHCLVLADLRQAAGVLVAERAERRAAQPRLYRLRDIAALLLGGRRDAGHGFAVGAIDDDGIADRKDIAMARYCAIRLALQPPGAIG
jgi:hypothetical protein